MINESKMFQFRLSKKELDKLKRHKDWLLEKHQINVSLSGIVRGYVFATIDKKESSSTSQNQTDQDPIDILQSLRDAENDMDSDYDNADDQDPLDLSQEFN